MDRISARDLPPVQLVLVHERVSALEVHRELEQRVVLALDVVPRDFLLDDGLAPVVVEPCVRDLLLLRVRVQQRVRCADDVEVDLEVDDVVVERPHWIDWSVRWRSDFRETSERTGGISDGCSVAGLGGFPEASLEVPGCRYPNLDRTICMEDVVELQGNA